MVGRSGGQEFRRRTRLAKVWLSLASILVVLGPAAALFAFQNRLAVGHWQQLSGRAVAPAVDQVELKEGRGSSRAPESSVGQLQAGAAQSQRSAEDARKAIPGQLRSDGSLVPRRVATRTVYVGPTMSSDRAGDGKRAPALQTPVLIQAPRLVVRAAAHDVGRRTGPGGVPEMAREEVVSQFARRVRTLDVPLAPEAAADAVDAAGSSVTATVEAKDAVTKLAEAARDGESKGGLDPALLKARLDARKSDPTFDHSTTAFVLTGKHKQVSCERCHTSMLKGTPNKCIDCH